MPIFEIGDIVRVQFPYIDLERREVRPALIVSRPVGPDDALVWALMITSAANRGWRGDVSIETDHRAMGLPIPSVVRCEKIAVVEVACAERVGRVPDALIALVSKNMRAYLWMDD